MRQSSVIFGAIGDQHQRRGLGDHRKKGGEHGFADLVDPVRILHDEDRRFGAGQLGGVDQRGQPPSSRIGVDLGQLDIGIGDARQVIKQHEVLRIGVGNLRPHLCPCGLIVHAG